MPFVHKKMPQKLHNGDHGTSVAVPTIDNYMYMQDMSAEQPRKKGSPLPGTETCVHPGSIAAQSENAFRTTGKESIMNPNAI